MATMTSNDHKLRVRLICLFYMAWSKWRVNLDTWHIHTYINTNSCYRIDWPLHISSQNPDVVTLDNCIADRGHPAQHLVDTWYHFTKIRFPHVEKFCRSLNVLRVWRTMTHYTCCLTVTIIVTCFTNASAVRCEFLFRDVVNCHNTIGDHCRKLTLARTVSPVAVATLIFSYFDCFLTHKL